MVLSNAQRQALYRKRLKARADRAGLADEAAAAVDAGYLALWDITHMLGPNGEEVGGLEDFTSVADWQAHDRETGSPAETLAHIQSWLDDHEWPITDDQRRQLELAAGVYRAVLLHHVPLPGKRPAFPPAYHSS